MIENENELYRDGDVTESGNSWGDVSYVLGQV